ncbi:unnamed protein product [Peronospora destructor]|uniref:Uncharacterized protein n=1 Tax=Peronospora destructor TaxID=86335 RepID=A0AAV0VAR7_9STRA|nr:unnamed protein product [Peronospora destructor]
MASTRRRNVVLYFDLNRTFVMSDAAGSRTIENAVNYLLSECTWGYVNPLLHSNGRCTEIDLFVDDHHTIGLPALPDYFRLKLKLSAQCIAAFYRDGFEADGTALALGTLTKVLFSTKLAEEGAYAPNNFYSTSDQNVKVVRGFQSIQETLEGMLEGASILALRDYWEWWSAQAENGQYGKLLLIDEEKAEMNGDITVFFDDHIDANHSHIVDVRDVRSGASVDFEKSCGKYLQWVEPIAAITDPNYFISLFEKYVV